MYLKIFCYLKTFFQKISKIITDHHHHLLSNIVYLDTDFAAIISSQSFLLGFLLLMIMWPIMLMPLIMKSTYSQLEYLVLIVFRFFFLEFFSRFFKCEDQFHATLAGHPCLLQIIYLYRSYF